MVAEKTIFLEIFQPFAQYRNPFTFYYAQTFPLPPKSTIIGMLQNAVGDWYGKSKWYKVENEKGEELIENRWWDLKISVHGGFESVFWNYQSLIKGDITLSKKEGNPMLVNQKLPLYRYGLTSQRSPVHQQELFNGHLYIFIKGEEDLINTIKESLKEPRKILYLGRSEDIIFIKKVIADEEIKLVKSGKVEKDVWFTYPTYILDGNFPIKNKKYPVYSIPVKVIFENKGIPIKTKGEITKTTERKPEFEPVIYTGYNKVIYIEEGRPLYVEKYELKYSNEELLNFIIPKDYGWL